MHFWAKYDHSTDALLWVLQFDNRHILKLQCDPKSDTPVLICDYFRKSTLFTVTMTNV